MLCADHRQHGRDEPKPTCLEMILPMNDWLPDTNYYRYHAERFRRSFASLPSLHGCKSVLCVGSWGDEAPYLRHLGAERVTCVRAPAPNVPSFETTTRARPDGQGKCDVALYAFDVETEDWPNILKGFDLVLLWEVLEHLKDSPSRMLYQAIRATRVGGTLSLTTPNALWHVYTIAQIFGGNALGLKIQHHIPFATHWRLWSPAEVSECFEKMGCASRPTSFLDEGPYPTLKSRIAIKLLQRMRKASGNGPCSTGRHVHVLAQKHSEPEMEYRPEWLYPRTEGES